MKTFLASMVVVCLAVPAFAQPVRSTTRDQLQLNEQSRTQSQLSTQTRQRVADSSRTDLQCAVDAATLLPVEPVSEAEAATLVFMREEEKLAHDVYVALEAKWGLRIFANIAVSEQKHVDAVLGLMAKYAIADPAAEAGAGVFLNADLQALYDALVAKGELSIIDALTVGATIEDLDIVDLENALAAADNLDIDQVYGNLQQGSRNHLRSFTTVLLQNGVAYEPQYLSLAEYEAIITSPMETGAVGPFQNPLACGGPSAATRTTTRTRTTVSRR